ncbi:MAG: hypothetical protein WBX25_37260, partial [Rhodomicrobium sp.]
HRTRSANPAGNVTAKSSQLRSWIYRGGGHWRRVVACEVPEELNFARHGWLPDTPYSNVAENEPGCRRTMAAGSTAANAVKPI